MVPVTELNLAPGLASILISIPVLLTETGPVWTLVEVLGSAT